jgi:hypothetical protein
MKLERQKILIDIDDTLLKSPDDLVNYEYRFEEKNTTQKEINQMYQSDDSLMNVDFNDGAIDFILKYSKQFDIVFVSYGTELNLMKKLAILNDIFAYRYQLNNIYFAAFEIGKANKSEILLDNTYIAIDSHSEHLAELNAPKKILLKNFQETKNNITPINDEYTYVVNSFKDIDEMISFDLKLKEMGVWLDA